MAARHSSGAVITASAPPPYLSPADVAAHDAASHVRRVPVPPPYLSPKGSAALDRLLTVVATDRAVTRYSVLTDLIERLTARDSHYMTPAEVDSLRRAQDERADLHFGLKAAGQLHLVVAR